MYLLKALSGSTIVSVAHVEDVPQVLEWGRLHAEAGREVTIEKDGEKCTYRESAQVYHSTGHGDA